jgi:TLC domain
VVIWFLVSDWNYYELLQGQPPAQAWRNLYFYETWVSTALYFLVDLIWVSFVPSCVKSPGTIIKHHVVAMLYLLGPLNYPEYRWFMGACLSVEINTWFLILRRLVYKTNNTKRTDSLYGAAAELVSLSFYISWIVIRCYIYPAVFYIFLKLAVQKVRTTGILFHSPMLFIPVHAVLCVLNLKWSYDLFYPIFAKWWTPSAAARDETVASGL